MQAQVNHIGLVISDLAKARHFYSDILGLREVPRPDFFIKGIWYDLGSFRLHLMLHEEPKVRHVHPLNETVQPHFALSITSEKMSEALERLRLAGVQLIPEPSSPLANEERAFFYDFDYNMIELQAI
jgi:glyoxylase I family protein